MILVAFALCTADVVCKSFPAAPGLKESAVGSESVSSVCELLSGSVSETADNRRSQLPEIL